MTIYHHPDPKCIVGHPRSPTSQISLPTSDLRSLHSAQLLSPGRRRLHLLDGAQLIGSVAGNTDVVISLEDELQVAQFEGRGLAEFGEFAGGDDDLIDEVVGDLEKGLERTLVRDPEAGFI